MITVQILSSWNHVVVYIGQSMISDFIFHGHPYWVFRRKQIIRTHLLSETSSDYFCLVRVARIELTASWTPFKRATKTALHPDIVLCLPTEALATKDIIRIFPGFVNTFLHLFLIFSRKVWFSSYERRFTFLLLHQFPLPRPATACPFPAGAWGTGR